ncbi:hypothetical protein [Pseudomonas sp. B329]|uniref:hypothetical protein n=1 Tax=Pseudomonas sp. B329 TaxID=1553459 RepID=UPI002004F3CF|nr:hypothetical protein [Pseudomonas sp. B329]MCK3864234.1 hypothetical protein [Pseudomonas sp. B329]
MSASDRLDAIDLPPLIRRAVDQYRARIERAQDLAQLALAQERAGGFVEGVDAARALTPATVETLSISLDDAVTARHEILEA